MSARAFQTGREAFPEVRVDEARFAAYLAARAGKRSDALGDAEAVDLYLACGCAAADPAAVAAFERLYLGRVPQMLSHLRLQPELLREVRQLLAERLLVASAGRAARIEDYEGRGPLSAWVRIAAIRVAVNLGIRERKYDLRESGARVASALQSDTDPELGYIQSRYRADFGEALREALAALSAEDRNLLRQHIVEGKTHEELAALHGVHSTTVGRWLQRARARILEGTRARVMERLRLRSGELESLLGLVRSNLELSLSGILLPPR